MKKEISFFLFSFFWLICCQHSSKHWTRKQQLRQPPQTTKSYFLFHLMFQIFISKAVKTWWMFPNKTAPWPPELKPGSYFPDTETAPWPTEVKCRSGPAMDLNHRLTYPWQTYIAVTYTDVAVHISSRPSPRAQVRSRARRWSCQALRAGWIVLLLSCSSTALFLRTLSLWLFRGIAVERASCGVHKLLLTGEVPASCCQVLAMADNLFSLYGSEGRDEPSVGSRCPLSPVPSKPYVTCQCGRKATWKESHPPISVTLRADNSDPRQFLRSLGFRNASLCQSCDTRTWL